MFFGQDNLYGLNVRYENRTYQAIYDETSGSIYFRTHRDIDERTYLEVREVGYTLMEGWNPDIDLMLYHITTTGEDEQYGLDVYKTDISDLRSITRSYLNEASEGVYLAERQYQTYRTILAHLNSMDSPGEWDKDELNRVASSSWAEIRM